MNMAAATRAATPPSKMTLANVRRSRKTVPDRILLVGTEGVGKSTFAADAPNPIFIASEDGLSHLDVEVFPQPETFTDVLDAVRTLRTEEHNHRTLVIDTLDWLEPVIWAELCSKNSWTKGIETPGYGKGYVAAAEEWRRLIAELDRLRAERGMEIILLAHAAIKAFSNPAGDDFSRYECKLHKTAAALVKEWCDVNLFAIHEEFAATNDRGKATGKGVSTGRRVIHTERTAAWDAKNRHGLPALLPLSYPDYVAAREAGQPAPPVDYMAAIAELIGRLPEADRAAVQGYVERNADNATALAKTLDRLRTKVSELPVEEVA